MVRNAPKTSRSSEIYDDLLEEVLLQSSPKEDRPLKKRKSQRDSSEVIAIDGPGSGIDKSTRKGGHDVVVIESSSDNMSEDDDEMEWDTVDLSAAPLPQDFTETETTPAIREVTLAASPKKSTFVDPLQCN